MNSMNKTVSFALLLLTGIILVSVWMTSGSVLRTHSYRFGYTPKWMFMLLLFLLIYSSCMAYKNAAWRIMTAMEVVTLVALLFANNI